MHVHDIKAPSQYSRYCQCQEVKTALMLQAPLVPRQPRCQACCLQQQHSNAEHLHEGWDIHLLRFAGTELSSATVHVLPWSAETSTRMTECPPPLHRASHMAGTKDAFQDHPHDRLGCTATLEPFLSMTRWGLALATATRRIIWAARSRWSLSWVWLDEALRWQLPPGGWTAPCRDVCVQDPLSESHSHNAARPVWKLPQELEQELPGTLPACSAAQISVGTCMSARCQPDIHLPLRGPTPPTPTHAKMLDLDTVNTLYCADLIRTVIAAIYRGLE